MKLTLQSIIGTGRIRKLIQSLVAVLDTCHNEGIRSKMKMIDWPQHLAHYIPMCGICCHCNLSYINLPSPKSIAASPHPNDASDDILLQLVQRSQICHVCNRVDGFRYINVRTNRNTLGRTDLRWSPPKGHLLGRLTYIMETTRYQSYYIFTLKFDLRRNFVSAQYLENY